MQPMSSFCSRRWRRDSFNNIQTVAQTVQLTHDIQAARSPGRGYGNPDYGIRRAETSCEHRVTTAPDSGNMSIGATWGENATRYASAVGMISGQRACRAGCQRQPCAEGTGCEYQSPANKSSMCAVFRILQKWWPNWACPCKPPSSRGYRVGSRHY